MHAVTLFPYLADNKCWDKHFNLGAECFVLNIEGVELVQGAFVMPHFSEYLILGGLMKDCSEGDPSLTSIFVMAATLFGKRTQAGAKINELGYEVLLQTALKLCCCIAEFSGATVLPRSFVRAAWRQAGRTVPAGDVTVNDFVQTFMPITTERLRVKTGTGDWFDNFKWNRLPSQLSNTDCVLQEFVKSRKIHIGALAFGAARRGLNESFHFEFVMQNYSNPNYTLDSQSDFSVLPQSYNETTMQVEAPK